MCIRDRSQPLVASAAFNSVDIEIQNGEALNRPAVFGDTNGDGVVSPVDALQIINALNADRSDSQSSQSLAASDIDGDGETTPLDALLVINQLNAQAVAELVDTADANETSDLEDKDTDSVFASLSLDLEDDDDLFPFRG